MLIYLIIGLAILIPFVSPKGIKGISLIIALLLLFIPWGLQYKVTWDWEEYSQRWDAVMLNSNQIGNRILEPGYVWLMKICKSIGFFGFLIVCAIFFLSIIFIFIRKFVMPKWYWLSIMHLMCNSTLGFLLIDTNRQTLAIGITMIAVFLMLHEKNKYKYSSWIINYLMPILLILSATLIHSSAYFSLLLFPLYFFVKKVRNLNIVVSLITFHVLYWGRYVLNTEILQNVLSDLWKSYLVSDNTMLFTSYLEEIGTSTGRSRILTYVITLFLSNTFLCFYNRMDSTKKFFGMCMLFCFIFEGYFTNTLQRVLVYFNIYSIIIVPYIFREFNRFLRRKEYSSFLYSIVLVICVCIYSSFFYHSVTSNIYYKKWGTDFVTIFEAPRWK